MSTSNTTLCGKVALVTGGARRIGAAIVRHLHGAGMEPYNKHVQQFAREGASSLPARERES